MAKKRKSRDQNSRESILRAFDPGQWFQFPRIFLVAFKPRDAIMLAYLINHAQMVDAEKKNEGWFYCKMDRMKKELFIGSVAQSRIVASLRRRKIVQSKMVGNPAKRWLWIDYIRLAEILEQVEEKFEC